MSRRNAAEKAQTKTAANGSAADIIAAAQARAAAKKVSPEQQQAKLERSIAGAEMRVQMAKEKLAEADVNQTDEQKNALIAAVETAKQKLEQAKARLAEHVKQHDLADNGEKVD